MVLALLLWGKAAGDEFQPRGDSESFPHVLRARRAGTTREAAHLRPSLAIAHVSLRGACIGCRRCWHTLVRAAMLYVVLVEAVPVEFSGSSHALVARRGSAGLAMPDRHSTGAELTAETGCPERAGPR